MAGTIETERDRRSGGISSLVAEGAARVSVRRLGAGGYGIEIDGRRFGVRVGRRGTVGLRTRYGRRIEVGSRGSGTGPEPVENMLMRNPERVRLKRVDVGAVDLFVGSWRWRFESSRGSAVTISEE